MIARRTRKKVSAFSLQPPAFARAGFTLVEIAICLAIIGIALVGIIGALPLGMRTQRDNREQTVINQDATVFMEAIRNGSHGLDDLTNYVFAITNYWTKFNPNGAGVNGYTYTASSATPSFPINSGARIIGLLSTPEYTDINGTPLPNLFNGGYSNHIVAYVRSLSGPAVEKPPQDNSLLRESSFSYRIVCANVPVQSSANVSSAYTTNLQVNLHELRLMFEWPQLPNGGLGLGRQAYRTMVAGQIAYQVTNNTDLYFFQSQSFTNAP
jgi:prepilin-type N-terminal cleavage/methylation domain-containing protein